jgi:hypothetical protein
MSENRIRLIGLVLTLALFLPLCVADFSCWRAEHPQAPACLYLTSKRGGK